MSLYLLSLLLVLSAPLEKTPNFYPNFLAAKEASKNYNKDLLIFFTKKACSECDNAWNTFEKDPIASKLYISTAMSIQDFDGAVFMDKYGLKNAPSWLLLDPQGQVKDKWEGDWKKTPTRPSSPTAGNTPDKTAAVPTTSASAMAEEKVVATQKEVTVSKPVTPAPTETVQPATPVSIAKEETIVEDAVIEVTEETPLVTTAEETTSSGYVIQVGYFGSASNAQGLVTSLEEKGFSGFVILEEERNASTFHRVVSAAYPTEEKAQLQAEVMEKAGIKSSVKNKKDL